MARVLGSEPNLEVPVRAVRHRSLTDRASEPGLWESGYHSGKRFPKEIRAVTVKEIEAGAGTAAPQDAAN